MSRAHGLRWRRAVAVVAAVASLALAQSAGPQPAAGAATNALPSSMAAIGDSITQATNSDLLHIGAANPGQSWSVGSDQDTVVSHYERILARNGAIAGRNFNDAEAGRTMSDAPRQATAAVAQGAGYVTVLLGVNDLCAASPDAMTSPGAYETSLRQALATLTTGLPAVRVYIASVPDLYQLWDLNKGNLVARLTWAWFNVCPAMLSASNTEAGRLSVRTRNVEYNGILRRVCAEYVQCRYDDDRVFRYRFTPADISIVDHFHLSTTGQANLAETTWRGGYWPEL